MSTLSYPADADFPIVSDEQLLSEAQAKYRGMIATGQQYTIVGSRTVVNPAFTAIVNEVSRLERRCLYPRGFTGRNVPDYSTDSSTDDVPE